MTAITRHPKRPSKAALRRLNDGTEPQYCVDPELSAKRRAAGIAGRMKQLAAQGKQATIRIDPRQFEQEAPYLLPVLANGQILPRSHVLSLAHRLEEARDIAAKATPQIVQALIDIAASSPCIPNYLRRYCRSSTA